MANQPFFVQQFSASNLFVGRLNSGQFAYDYKQEPSFLIPYSFLLQLCTASLNYPQAISFIVRVLLSQSVTVPIIPPALSEPVRAE